MSDFTPKTRLEKILCGVVTTAKTRLEKAVKYAVENAGGGGGGVIESNFVVSIDSETGKQIITADKTAAELFDACTAGKKVFGVCTIQDGENPIVLRKTLAIDGQVIGDDEEAVYEFCFSTVSQEEGLMGFLAANLSADDTVVFTQV